MAQGTMTTARVATASGRNTTATTQQPLRANLAAMLLVMLLAGAVRLLLVGGGGFPLNDGGFVYEYIASLLAANFSLPDVVVYNGEALPYAGPPAAYYLVAVAHRLTDIPVLSLMLWLPLLLTTLTTLYVYMFSLSYFRSARLGLLVMLAFAALPSTVYNVMAGGGVPASVGMLFSVAALWQGVWLVREESNWHLPATALFAAVALLSDFRWGGFTLVSLLVLFASGERSLRAGAQLGVLLVTIAALVAPWGWIVVSRYTVVPFFNVFFDVWDVYSPFAPLWTPFSSLTLEPGFAVLNVLAVLGVFVALAQGRFNIVLWLGAVLLLLPDGAQSVTVLPLALAAALALDHLVLTGLASFSPSATARRRGLSTVGVVAAIFALGYPLVYPVYAHHIQGDRALRPLSVAQRTAMQTVATDFPPDASFALLTDSISYDQDAVAAWFPILAARTSTNTVQGASWRQNGELGEAVGAYNRLQACRNQRTACLEAWRLETNRQFTHVWLGENTDGLLRATLADNNGYELAYNADGILIYARR